MDVSNRRKAPPSNVVAGSVWENRMKMDEVKGGIKVFKGEEETYQEDGVKPIQPNQPKRERRKTWKPEPIEIIGGTPIQVRKPRSDPRKLFSKSVDGIQKNPLFVDQSRSLFHENGKLDFDEDSFDDDEEETHFSANVKEEEKIDQIPIASNVKEEKRKTWKAEPFEIIGGNPIQVTKSRSDSHMFFDKSSDEIEKNPSYINKSGSLFDGRIDVDEDSWVYDDEEEEVIEKEIEEKSFYVKEAEKPIPISAIEKKLTPDVDILDQKPNKVVEEEKKLDEKPMPISVEVDIQEEEKPKKNVKGQRRKSLKSELLEVIGANPVQVRKSRYDPHTVSSTKPVNELEKNPVIRKARSLFQRNRIFEVDLDVDDFDDESEEGVVEKEIQRMEKSSDLKEVEKPISISANVSKLIPEYEGLEQKPKKIVKEDKRPDKVIEKPAPSVDFPEKKSKKVVREEKKLVHMSTNVRKQPEIEMAEQKPEKVVKEDQVHEKPMSISANVNGQSLRLRSYVATDHNSFKPPPTVEECKRFPVAQNKLQSIVDLVMWNDVFKSALLFGFSTCILISSSYIENLNISLMSATCYLGLLFLAAISLYKLILSREDIDLDYSREVQLVGEQEAIRLLKLILPYFNEFLLKIRSLFYGDPATTMKLAVLLFVLAQYGSFITVWKILKLGVFGSFIVPKAYCSYSTNLTNHVNSIRSYWHSCHHKKYMALVVFILVWNFSSMVTRIWAVFMLVLAGRYYQQSLLKDEWVQPDEAKEG